MSMAKSPKRLRVLSFALILTGVAVFFGLRSLFLDNWIVATMFGALSWIEVGGYLAIATAVIGGVLLVVSFLMGRD